MQVGEKVKITNATKYGHHLAVGSEGQIISIRTKDSIEILGESRIDGRKIQQNLHPNDFELIKNTNMTKDMKTAVITTAHKLLKANNTVTTLEIKTDLIINYKSFYWKQIDVSEIMDEAAKQNEFNYSDNGTFRIYSEFRNITGLRGLVKGSAKALAAGKKAAQTKAANKGVTLGTGNIISRTKALDLIKNSKGAFLTVEFTKKDGTNRVLNGQYNSAIQPNLGLGLVTLRENIKAKLNPNDSLRQFDINRLKALKIKGNNYKIK